MFQRAKIVLGEKGEVHSAQKGLFLSLGPMHRRGHMVSWSTG